MTAPRVVRAAAGRRLPALSDTDAREIAVEAYVYAYPLVLMEITRRTSTNVPAADESGSAPMNRFGHRLAIPDPSFTAIPRPNADALYSMLWFDVAREPLVIHVPDSGGRYFLLPILDMWTDVFASPGSRTTGDTEQEFAIVGPAWHGSLPSHVEPIHSPTAQGWMIGRTQTNGRADYELVHAFQAGLRAVPLQHYGSVYNPPDARVDMRAPQTPPLDQVRAMDALSFFSLFVRLTRANPPHAMDYPLLARLGRLGIESGRVFDIDEVAPAARAAIEEAPVTGTQRIVTSRSARNVNGWALPRPPQGTYGTDYLHRAEVAYHWLGSNLTDDAIYAPLLHDSLGQVPDSDTRYVLHFDPGQTPPVRGFWSLTMYDSRQLLVANAVNRYAITDRDALKFNEDGSVDVYIQRESPGPDRESNWLPTPAHGPFVLTLRLYWPRTEAINGTWKPPAMTPAAT